MIRQKLHEAQDRLQRRREASVQESGEPAARSFMKSTQVLAWYCYINAPFAQ